MTSGAERQRLYRKRHRERLAQERAAARERQRVLELPADAKCRCCGEDQRVFLKTAALCFNCAHASSVGICPHQGVSRKLG